MRILVLFTLTISSLIFSSSAFANGLDDKDQLAVRQSQDFLKNKEERNKFIDKDANAKKADDYAKKIGGGDQGNVDEMYSISAGAMDIIAAKSNGDPVKMQELMKVYEKNPEQFLNDMPAEQRAQIEKLGRKIGNTQSPR